MHIKIDNLTEPQLVFGNKVKGVDPKPSLAKAGPFGSTYDEHLHHVRLGLVAPHSEVGLIRRWVERMHQLLLEGATNAARFHEFPGSEKAFQTRFDLPEQFIRRLDEDRLASAFGRRPHQSFQDLLDLYTDAIKPLFVDQGPDCILVMFPELVANLRVVNPKLSVVEQRALERAQSEEDERQIELFEPTAEEKIAAAELLPQADDLLFRSFHRALKAKCMADRGAIPLQIIRRQTYIAEEALQSNATRAWNLATALYYKSGGRIPWLPSSLDRGTCFIGISFHHLKRRSGDIVYASVAQAFASSLEPFALKGESVPPEQVRNKRPFLKSAQASALAERVVHRFELTTGAPPQRVVIHKTSRYEPEEQEGFRNALKQKVPSIDLVSLAPTGFRLLRRGFEEPERGTLCTVEDRDHYLFTTGYIPWWREYPGPHIPAPIQLAVSEPSEIARHASDVLTLTKMNWNNAEGLGRYPITITFARRVGAMMTEIDELEEPNPLYRYYM